MADQQRRSLASSKPTHEEQARSDAMLLAWKSYRGDMPKPLKAIKGQPDDNVLSNRCAPVVDKGISFLFGSPLKIEAVKVKSDAAEYLTRTWGAGEVSDEDDTMSLLADIAMNGAVCGQAFAKLIPPVVDGDGDTAYPRIVALDPQKIRVITLPDDIDCVVAYLIEYTWDDMCKREVIARCDPDQPIPYDASQLDATWTISQYLRQAAQQDFVRVGEPQLWPYPFAPIFDGKNLPNPNEHWGTPDLTPDIIGMNMSLNFVNSNTNRIIKYHAHPKTWISGMGPSQIDTSVDGTIVLPAAESKIGSLEMHGDLKSSRDFAADLRADMDEQSRVPAVALGRLEALPKGNISGVALQLLFQPLIEKTTIKQRLYGKLIREVSRAILVMGNFIDAKAMADTNIELHWASLLPNDDLQAAQVAQIYKALGVSDDTILQSLGFDPDVEVDKSQQEDARKVTAFSRGQGLPGQLAPPMGLPQLPPASGMPGMN